MREYDFFISRTGLNSINMFVPVTSEVTIKTGMVLKEIATDELFKILERLADRTEVLGEDIWAITKVAPRDLQHLPVQLTRQELSMKYLAEVDE
jgi:hypothetical protein